jgi:hypothetical protein
MVRNWLRSLIDVRGSARATALLSHLALIVILAPAVARAVG